MKLAFAASLPVVSLLAPSVAWAQDSDWSGAYVGAYVGATGGSTSTEDYWCWAACDAPTLKKVSAEVGVTAGYNIQVDDSFLVGLEADFGTGSKRVLEINRTPTGPVDFVWKANHKWQSALRARTGLISGKTVMFVTGGLAVTNSDFSIEADGSRLHGVVSSEDWGTRWNGTLIGYTYGAGIEHSMGRLSAKVEYIHSVFESKQNCYMDLTGPNAGACWDPLANPWFGSSTVTFNPTISNIRIGLNYRF